MGAPAAVRCGLPGSDVAAARPAAQDGSRLGRLEAAVSSVLATLSGGAYAAAFVGASGFSRPILPLLLAGTGRSGRGGLGEPAQDTDGGHLPYGHASAFAAGNAFLLRS